jgi:hypothetical protein
MLPFAHIGVDSWYLSNDLEDRWVHVVAWLVEALEAGMSRVRVPMRALDFIFNLPNASSRTMAPGSTQSPTEMSIRNLPGDKGRPARNFTAICEPIV